MYCRWTSPSRIRWSLRSTSSSILPTWCKTIGRLVGSTARSASLLPSCRSAEASLRSWLFPSNGTLCNALPSLGYQQHFSSCYYYCCFFFSMFSSSSRFCSQVPRLACQKYSNSQALLFPPPLFFTQPVLRKHTFSTLGIHHTASQYVKAFLFTPLLNAAVKILVHLSTSKRSQNGSFSSFFHPLYRDTAILTCHVQSKPSLDHFRFDTKRQSCNLFSKEAKPNR